jgi:hypothetical protein
MLLFAKQVGCQGTRLHSGNLRCGCIGAWLFVAMVLIWTSMASAEAPKLWSTESGPYSTVKKKSVAFRYRCSRSGTAPI